MSTKNQSSHFGLTEEIMVLSLILLAVTNTYVKSFDIFLKLRWKLIQMRLHKRFGHMFHCAIRKPTGLLLRVQFSAKKWRNVSIKFRLSLTDGALPLYFHEIFHCRPFSDVIFEISCEINKNYCCDNKWRQANNQFVALNNQDLLS